MNARVTLSLVSSLVLASSAASAANGIVSFKDADKIKSWGAWGDHLAKVAVTNILQKEKPCVTMRELKKLLPGAGFKEIGTLATRTSREIKSSNWSIGCETLDRDYADWDAYKGLLPDLGVKRARFFSGWAKTEQEKNVYDFTWLDPQIRECAAMGIKPWICSSYGSPVWGSDFRLGMRVRQVTENPEALAAWLRYAKALVERYKDVVDEWEIWNEPFFQSAHYMKLFYETAKVVKEIQPEAKCYCTAIGWKANEPDPKSHNEYWCVIDHMTRMGHPEFGSRFIYHPYNANPDDTFDYMAKLRAFVKSCSPDYDIYQGEVGCPAQLEFAHALANLEWTEYSQAKWNLRRTIGDAAYDVPCNVFTMIDLKYTFMLQSFGLVRSNLLREFVYRRPSYFAMRNVFSYFDSEVRGLGVETIETAPWRKLRKATFARGGEKVHCLWFGEKVPSSRLAFERVDLERHAGLALKDPVWVELITGRVFAFADLKSVPLWDSPVMVAERSAVPLAR